jgi:hypothetical protein
MFEQPEYEFPGFNGTTALSRRQSFSRASVTSILLLVEDQVYSNESSISIGLPWAMDHQAKRVVRKRRTDEFQL